MRRMRDRRRTMSSSRAIWQALVFMVLAFSGLTVWGQTGAIVGQVTDPSGAVIPGVSVTVTNTATGIETKSVSNAAGHYELINLQPGPYLLEVEANGFKKLVRPGIIVQVEDRLGIDLQPQVGNVSETVSVTAGAPLLQTEDLQTGEVVNYQMIQDLPQYNRDPLQLITLSGNVQGSGSEAGGGSDTRINGGRSSGIDYLVDGVSVVIGQAHTVNGEAPSMDDVEEFKVITNGPTADIGRVSGGAVTLVTKGGTNDLHGQLFGYYQGQFLDDSGWSQKALGGKKTPYHQGDVGFTVGGPVVLPHLYHGQNKTFFFATYEGIRKGVAGQLNITQFPTAAERSGDMSGTFLPGKNGPVYPSMYKPCYEPGDCSSSPVQVAAGAGDPGNPGGMEYQKYNPLGGDGMHIPSSLISPVSTAILKYIPLPNHAPIAGTSDSGNYVGAQNSTYSSNVWSVRIDQAFTDKSRMYGRFIHSQNIGAQSSWAGPLIPATSQGDPGGWGLTLNYNYVFTPTLTMTLTAGGYYSPYQSGSALGAGINTSNFGFDSVTAGFLNGNMLYTPVNFEYNAGTQNIPFGNSASTNVGNSTNVQFGGSFTKVLTHHTLQFGAESRRYYDDTYSSGGGQAIFIGDPMTQYGYDAGYGSLYSDVNSLGSFLMGLEDLASAQSFFNRDLAQNYYASYIQDSYKASSRLTLSLGLRWDMETPVTERHDKLYLWDSKAQNQFSIASGWNWDSALASAGLTSSQIQSVQTPSWVTGGFPTGAIRIANTPEHPSRLGTPYHPWQFAPRLGGAYKVDDKTVVRAFVGIMYLPTTGDPNGFGSVPSVSMTSAAANSWHQNNYGVDPTIANWSNPYLPSQVTAYTRSNQVANFQSTGGSGSGGVSSTLHMPHEYDINVGIQRELPHQFLVEADYSSNVSHSLLGPDMASEFPKNLFVPQNQGLYTTQNVPSPNWAAGASSGQTENNGVTGPTQSLALLEYPMPYFGTVQVTGRNIGRSNFQSLNLRLEKRLSHGYQILFNYQYSKLLDNVGGPEDDVSNSGGSINYGNSAAVGPTNYQTVDTIRNVYGLSPLDEKHHITATYLYQVPFGEGRTWLSHPSGVSGHILDGFVGGWEIAGNTVYRSGRPIVFSSSTENINNNIRVEVTFPSCAFQGCTGIVSKHFGGGKSVLVAPGQSLSPNAVPAFDSTAIKPAAAFTYGNLPPVWGGLRNPGNILSGLSLMKAFPLFGGSKESRYLQFRAEANNAFNITGLGSYNSDLGEPGFGTITGVANQERHIQTSLRYVF